MSVSRPLTVVSLLALTLGAACATSQKGRQEAETATNEASAAGLPSDIMMPPTRSPPKDLPVRMNGAEMTCPAGEWTPARRLEGPFPTPTKEVIEARETGLLLARCTLTAEGRMSACKLVKGPMHMGAVLLQSLEQSRYEPVKCRGVPVESDYVASLQLKLRF